MIVATGLLLAALVAAAGQEGGSCAVTGRRGCVVDLHGAHAPSLSPDCSAEPWARYLKLMLPDRFVDSNKDGWWETVIEIALDPSRECGCAKLRIHFQDPVRDWSVNVGDSPTNNGFGGDAGTTNYAAEMQVLGDLLSVFTAASPKFGTLRFDGILQWNLPPMGGRYADVEVCDQVLGFDMPGGLAGDRLLRWRLQTPTGGVLYSLAPRSDLSETARAKKKDKGLYAGFNRVIGESGKGHKPRVGTGVRRVEITLSP